MGAVQIQLTDRVERGLRHELGLSAPVTLCRVDEEWVAQIHVPGGAGRGGHWPVRRPRDRLLGERDELHAVVAGGGKQRWHVEVRPNADPGRASSGPTSETGTASTAHGPGNAD